MSAPSDAESVSSRGSVRQVASDAYLTVYAAAIGSSHEWDGMGNTDEAGRPFVPVGVNLRTDDVETIVERWGIVPCTRMGPIHEHGLLASGRAILEKQQAVYAAAIDEVYAKDGGGILSVAPNFGRERRWYEDRLDSRYWACMPLIHPNDRGRIQTTQQIGYTRVCHHRFQECKCIKPTVIVSTHVAYYLSPQEIADQLERTASRIMFAIALEHRGIGGQRCDGESTWFRRLDGWVTERVRGNNTTYSHPAMDWAQAGGASVAQGFVSATAIRRCDETVLYRFRLVPRAVAPQLRPPPKTLFAWLTSEEGDNYEPGGFRADDVIETDVRITKYAVAGDACAVEFGEARGAVISRKAVASVVARLALIPRDHLLLKDAKFYAEGAYRGIQAPPELLSEAVYMTALLAMTLNVRKETDAAITVARHFGPIWQLHRAAVSLSPIHVFGAWTMAIISIVALVATGLLGAVPWQHHALFVASSVLWVIGNICILVTLCTRNRHLYGLGQTWTRLAVRGQPLSVEQPTSLTETLLPGHRELPPPVPTRPLLPGDLVVKPRRAPAHPSVEVPRTEIVGVQTTTTLPLAIEPTVEAELAGVRGRILKPVPIIVESAVSSLKERLEVSPRFAWLREMVVYWPTNLVSQWMRSRPPRKRERLEKALVESKRLGLDPHRLCSDTLEEHRAFLKASFLKMEKTLGTVDGSGAHAKTPRIIQALTDLLEVYVGPSLWWATQAWKKAADGRGGLLFASSRSNEAIGEFVQQGIAKCQDPLILFLDADRYDAHCGEGFREVEGTALYWSDVPVGVRAATLDSRPEGQTAHGVKYRTDDGLCSGAPDTSDGGTLYNADLHDAVLADLAPGKETVAGVPLGEPWDGAFGGDDSIVVIDARHLQHLGLPLAGDNDYSRAEAALKQAFVKYGITIDPHMSRNLWDAEFFSKIFLWVDDRKLKLSPKPGRSIAKLGSVMKTTNSANLAADVASLWVDGCHVPFLRVLLERLRTLVAGQRPRGRPDGEEDHRTHAAHMSVLHEDSWALIRGRYGLDREDEELFRQELQAVTRIPCVITSRIIRRLGEVDL